MELQHLLQFYRDHAEIINNILAILVIFFLVVGSLKLILYKTKKLLSAQAHLVLTKFITYGGTVLVILLILGQCGVELTALLGAAGVAGIAIGFAAQNSLANIFGGFFLLIEKPFQQGDMIQIDATTSGVVYSMDLLSVKLRTMDNKLIRVPNETLLKATVVNISHFPIRRLDLTIGVSYNDDVDKVSAILREIAEKNPFCLNEPEPIISFVSFNASSQDILLAVWFEKTDLLVLRDSLLKEIKKRFDAEGIEIPFPHQSVYIGAHTKPLPIQILKQSDGDIA